VTVLALTLTSTLTLFDCAAGVDVLPVFRLLYAQVAASCNGLAHALELRQGLKYVPSSSTLTRRGPTPPL